MDMEIWEISKNGIDRNLCAIYNIYNEGNKRAGFSIGKGLLGGGSINCKKEIGYEISVPKRP